MKVLILGATGYIGSEVYKELRKISIYTRGISRKNLSGNKDIGNINFLKKEKNLKKIVSRFDVIINCLGETKNESLMKKIHVDLLKKILFSISNYATRIKKNIQWIQISTIGIYGFDGEGVKKQLINDTTIENPLSLYEQTKFDSEKLLIKYSNFFLNYTILRVGTVISKKIRKTFFDNLTNLIKKKLFFFIGTKKTILNIIYLNDLVNIIVRCIGKKKVLNKKYNVANNFKLIDLVLMLQNNKKLLFPLVLSEVIVKKIFSFINFFIKKKKPSHKINFLTYQRKVSMTPILKDLQYKIKFNLQNILKDRYK